MSGEPVKKRARKAPVKVVRAAPREIPGLFLLHLPPWVLILTASVLSAIIGPLVIRGSSGVVDITLRLGWPMRLLSLLGVFIALRSGWRRPGARPIRYFGWTVAALSVLTCGVVLFKGEATPPWVFNASLAAAFASIPLYLRKAPLTEAWINGSMRPALYAAFSILAFLPALLLCMGYKSLWQRQASSMAGEINELAAGLRRLSDQGSLSEEEAERLKELAAGLPGSRSLWLAVAASPPGEIKGGRLRKGEVEEAVSGLLLAVQDLFLAPRAPLAVQGPWDLGGSPQSEANKKHYAKVRAYWDRVRQILADGKLLMPFLEDTGNPAGLTPDAKLRPEAEDIVGRVALFRGEVAARMESLRGVITALDGDAARLAEATAARAALAPYPSLRAPLEEGFTASLERATVESWSNLKLSGVALFDFWNLLTLQNPKDLLGETIRCFQDKPKSAKKGKKQITYSCPSYDLTAPDPASGLVVRTALVYQEGENSRAESIRLDLPRPKNLPTWKSEVLAALQRRGVTVSSRADGTGFDLEAPEGSADQTTLTLRFSENKARVGITITRAP